MSKAKEAETKNPQAHPEMLSWQYREIIAELAATCAHAQSEDCPCNQTELELRGERLPEFCLAKHLLNINFLSRETALMDEPNRDLFEDLADEAIEYHKKAKEIYCKGGTWPDLAEWSRGYRKKIELLYYTCSVGKKAKLHDGNFAELFEKAALTDTFTIDFEVSNPVLPGWEKLPAATVDTGGSLTIIPLRVAEKLKLQQLKNHPREIVQEASGYVRRRVFIAHVRILGRETPDLVWGIPGDIATIGSHTLETLGLRVDPVNKRLEHIVQGQYGGQVTIKDIEHGDLAELFEKPKELWQMTSREFHEYDILEYRKEWNKKHPEPGVTKFPDNDFGLVQEITWDIDSPTPELRDQLKKAGIEYSEVEVPHLVGIKGVATLVGYRSPKTGKDMTVLIIPYGDVDSYLENVIYIEKPIKSLLENENNIIQIYDFVKMYNDKHGPEYAPAYFESRIKHEKIIKKALSEGKPVPPEVLKDYPELQRQYQKAVVPSQARLLDLAELFEKTFIKIGARVRYLGEGKFQYQDFPKDSWVEKGITGTVDKLYSSDILIDEEGKEYIIPEAAAVVWDKGGHSLIHADEESKRWERIKPKKPLLDLASLFDKRQTERERKYQEFKKREKIEYARNYRKYLQSIKDKTIDDFDIQKEDFPVSPFYRIYFRGTNEVVCGAMTKRKALELLQKEIDKAAKLSDLASLFAPSAQEDINAHARRILSISRSLSKWCPAPKRPGDFQAGKVYRERAKDVGGKTATLYLHIAAEENQHYQEFKKRMAEIQGNLAEPLSTLPICSPTEAGKLERCIPSVKKKGTAVNPFAVCRVSVGCRKGGSAKYEAKISEVPEEVADAIRHTETVKLSENESGYCVCKDGKTLLKEKTISGKSHSIDIPVACTAGSPAALVHLHPSGNIEASRQDLETSKRLSIPVCVIAGNETKCYQAK